MITLKMLTLMASAIVSDEQLLTTVLVLEDNNPKGMEAIAEVVWNRAEGKPDRVRSVLLRKWQFSCLNSHTVHQGSLVSLVRKARGRSNWRTASKIAKATLAGKVEGHVGNATHYHVYRGKYTVKPYWSHPSLGGRNSKCRIVTKIGNHVYLQNVD